MPPASRAAIAAAAFAASLSASVALAAVLTGVLTVAAEDRRGGLSCAQVLMCVSASVVNNNVRCFFIDSPNAVYVCDTHSILTFAEEVKQ